MRTVSICAAALMIAGCNSGGGGGSTETAKADAAEQPVQSVMPNGVWTGTVSSSVAKASYRASLIISSDGEMRYTAANCVQVVGTVSIFDGKLSGTGTAIAPDYCEHRYVGLRWADGSKTAPFTVTGSSDGNTLSGAYVMGPDRGDSGTILFNRSSTLSSRGASIGAVAGSYLSDTPGGSVAIDSNGNVSGADSGGNYAGKVSIPDPAVNVYRVSYTYTPFDGSAPFSVNGLGFTGDGQQQNSILSVQVSYREKYALTELFTRN